MNAPITLFHYWRSSSSVRVRWALAIKDVAFESVHVDLLSGEQHGDEHVARSPLGYVPAIRIGTQLLTESVAICELLDDLYPVMPLRPSEPFARARMRQMVEIVNSGTQPLQNLVAMRKVSSVTDEQRAWARFWTARGLGAFEAVLARCHAEGISGSHCLGNGLTLADLFLVPQLANARRFQLDLTPYPLALEKEASAVGTDSYAAARPEAWQPREETAGERGAAPSPRPAR